MSLRAEGDLTDDQLVAAWTDCIELDCHRQTIADAARVELDDVALEMAPGSVLVTAHVRVPPGRSAEEIRDLLVAAFGTKALAGQAFNMTVLGGPDIYITIEGAPVPPPPPAPGIPLGGQPGQGQDVNPSNSEKLLDTPSVSVDSSDKSQVSQMSEL